MYQKAQIKYEDSPDKDKKVEKKKAKKVDNSDLDVFIQNFEDQVAANPNQEFVFEA